MTTHKQYQIGDRVRVVRIVGSDHLRRTHAAAVGLEATVVRGSPRAGYDVAFDGPVWFGGGTETSSCWQDDELRCGAEELEPAGEGT